MTETTWFSCTSPETMLRFLAEQEFVNQRKWRLFALACCRRIWPQLEKEESRTAVELSERFADSEDTRNDLRAARIMALRRGPFTGWSAHAANAAMAEVGCLSDNAELFKWVKSVALHASWATRPDEALISDSATIQARERVGQADLLRDMIHNPFRPLSFEPKWRTETVQALARTMYESREFSALPILADALMDAGCNEPAVLAHCRGDGPHVRGCWVVDALLGKS